MDLYAPPQADFRYDAPASDGAGLALSLSIYGDRSHVRDTMRDDAQAAGFQIREADALAGLLAESARPLGDVIMLDCPVPDAATLAALARLDMRAAHSGARLIVSTTLEGLDDVFGSMDQSCPQLLVDPTRAERVIALGRLLGANAPLRLRELAEEDRLVLLRLTEQVSQIASRLDGLAGPERQIAGDMDGERDGSAFRLASPANSFSARQDDTARLVRAPRPALPDPRLVRRIIRQRQLRGQFFDADLFADPAWDMLLDLTAARVEHTRVSVTSLCIASGVPPTTALRWIAQMTESGLFERVEDDTDRRRAFIVLSDKAADAMARYFVELGQGAAQLV